MELKHVDGKDKGNIVLFALSTCVWCKKVMMIIEELGIGYDYIYVDLTSGSKRSEVIAVLEKYNPRISFPTLVINESDVITGFKADEIKFKLRKIN